MFRSEGFRKALRITSAVAGWGFIVLAVAWLLYCVFHGGYFVFGDTEINLRDPVLIANKTLGLGFMAILFLLKQNVLAPVFRFLGTKRGAWCLWAITAFVFVAFSLLRYYLMSESAVDMAMFKSYLHHLSCDGSITIFVDYQRNLLGDHLFFIFFPYSLFYKLGGIELVIIIHKILMSCIVPLVYLLGKSLSLDEERVGFMALLGPLAPAFAQTGVGDYYVEGLIYPAGVAILWAFHARKWGWFVLASIFLIRLTSTPRSSISLDISPRPKSMKTILPWTMIIFEVVRSPWISPAL